MAPLSSSDASLHHTAKALVACDAAASESPANSAVVALTASAAHIARALNDRAALPPLPLLTPPRFHPASRQSFTCFNKEGANSPLSIACTSTRVQLA
jgi:hypothetical protein